MIWRTYVWSEARTSYQTPSSLISSVETGCGMENSRGKISNILWPLASFFCVCLLNFAHLLQLARPFEGLLLYQVRSETLLKAQNWLKRAVSPSLGWRMLKANPPEATTGYILPQEIGIHSFKAFPSTPQPSMTKWHPLWMVQTHQAPQWNARLVRVLIHIGKLLLLH